MKIKTRYRKFVEEEIDFPIEIGQSIFVLQRQAACPDCEINYKLELKEVKIKSIKCPYKSPSLVINSNRQYYLDFFVNHQNEFKIHYPSDFGREYNDTISFLDKESVNEFLKQNKRYYL